jgi:hypothetical protein
MWTCVPLGVMGERAAEDPDWEPETWVEGGWKVGGRWAEGAWKVPGAALGVMGDRAAEEPDWEPDTYGLGFGASGLSFFVCFKGVFRVSLGCV